MVSTFKKINQLCKEKNITIEQFCKDVDISKSALTSYRCGRRNIPTLKLRKIATYLGVPISYLEDNASSPEIFGSKVAEMTSDSNFMTYMTKLYSLNGANKKYVYRFIDLLKSNNNVDIG